MAGYVVIIVTLSCVRTTESEIDRLPFQLERPKHTATGDVIVVDQHGKLLVQYALRRYRPSSGLHSRREMLRTLAVT